MKLTKMNIYSDTTNNHFLFINEKYVSIEYVLDLSRDYIINTRMPLLIKDIEPSSSVFIITFYLIDNKILDFIDINFNKLDLTHYITIKCSIEETDLGFDIITLDEGLK